MGNLRQKYTQEDWDNLVAQSKENFKICTFFALPKAFKIVDGHQEHKILGHSSVNYFKRLYESLDYKVDLIGFDEEFSL